MNQFCTIARFWRYAVSVRRCPPSVIPIRPVARDVTRSICKVAMWTGQTRAIRFCQNAIGHQRQPKGRHTIEFGRRWHGWDYSISWSTYHRRVVAL